MSNILVDTDILIDFLRRPDKESATFQQTFLSGKHQASIALITVVELWAGKSAEHRKTEEFLNDLLTNCHVIFPSIEIAQRAGVLIRNSNYQLQYQDAEIAATALSHKLPLFTFNVKDYQEIPELKFWK